MSLADAAFYLFAGLTIVAAWITVTSKNIMYSAFALMFAFFGVAGLYVLLSADFIAVTQILIYIGGILVLMVFGVMLTNRQTDVEIKTRLISVLPPVAIVSFLVVVMVTQFWRTEWITPKGNPQEITATTQTLGVLMLTDFLLPFEIASVVLLVAIVGAAMIARKEPA